jgi:rubrerythrin
LHEGKTPILPIPERRPVEKQARAYAATGVAVAGAAAQKTAEAKAEGQSVEVKKKLWYCRQCGYVLFREDPPYVCPICKAKREMFAQIEINPSG